MNALVHFGRSDAVAPSERTPAPNSCGSQRQSFCPRWYCQLPAERANRPFPMRPPAVEPRNEDRLDWAVAATMAAMEAAAAAAGLTSRQV